MILYESSVYTIVSFLIGVLVLGVICFYFVENESLIIKELDLSDL